MSSQRFIVTGGDRKEVQIVAKSTTRGFTKWGHYIGLRAGIKGSRKTKNGGEEGQRGPHIDGTMGFKGVGEGCYKNMIEVKGEAYIF